SRIIDCTRVLATEGGTSRAIVRSGGDARIGLPCAEEGGRAAGLVALAASFMGSVVQAMGASPVGPGRARDVRTHDGSNRSGAQTTNRQARMPPAHPKKARHTAMDAAMPARSATSAQPTAWRARRMPTAPKYTAST